MLLPYIKRSPKLGSSGLPLFFPYILINYLFAFYLLYKCNMPHNPNRINYFFTLQNYSIYQEKRKSFYFINDILLVKYHPGFP